MANKFNGSLDEMVALAQQALVAGLEEFVVLGKAGSNGMPTQITIFKVVNAEPVVSFYKLDEDLNKTLK